MGLTEMRRAGSGVQDSAGMNGPGISTRLRHYLQYSLGGHVGALHLLPVLLVCHPLPLRGSEESVHQVAFSIPVLPERVVFISPTALN